jgi:aminopeptidase N
MRILLLIILLAVLTSVKGQDYYDVLHYRYEIELSDNSDTIYGKTSITVRFLSESANLVLDLGLQNDKGKGMRVERVTGPNVKALNSKDDKITISFAPALKAGDTATFFIPYQGIPTDGLIISKNKFGNRTFFSDNWPNRAHHWIPCKDDPSDKASVEFIITAPSHYQVVSNGLLVEETNLSNEKKLTHWQEDIPLPTKIMAVGAANFAVNLSGIVNCVPITSWVYPEVKEKGFYDYALAGDIVSFYSDLIGPYPYKKLANVQSKTIFGGMENANTIFYSEGSVTGNRNSETLLAHEIAHQWFGDMATEKHYAHLWLSEGFATYLTHIYIETKRGSKLFNTGLEEDRRQIINFVKSSKSPVVDYSSPYMQLLNANSYQKGGWILHMLRRQLGDSVFRKIIRSYYEQYKGKNADSKDFQTVAEQISKKNLNAFFDQWLYKAGIPKLQIRWKYNAQQKNIMITITQQTEPFIFPLQLSIEEANGTSKLVTYPVSKSTETFKLPVKNKPARFMLDPNVSLLFEGTIEESQ